jgi:hypothetical protein
VNYINVTTKMFFDKPGVVAAMSAKTHRVLSSTGAFARTVMQRGMRRRKGVSAPGDYPSAHGNSLLRDLLYFGFDASAQGVVVGPTLIGRNRRGAIVESGKTIPQLINEGGAVVRKSTIRGRGRRAIDKINRYAYRARPFVTLTLPKAAAKLAENMKKFELKKGA